MKNGGSSFSPWKISIPRHFVKGTDDGGWCEKILRGICAVVWDWDAWGQKSHRYYCKRRILFGTNMFLPKQKPSIFSLDLHDKKTDTWIYSLKSCKNIPTVRLGKVAQHAQLWALFMAKLKGQSQNASNMALGHLIKLQHIQKSAS